MVDKNSIPINVFVLGDTSTGKTEILNRYIENKFMDNYLSTLGIDRQMKLFKANKKQLKILFYNQSGQERFRHLCKNIIPKLDGVIYTFDITDKSSFEQLDSFLDIVKQYSNNNNPISVIFANKNDLKEKRKVSKEEIDNYAQKYNMKVFEVSAKTGENIKEGFNEIINQICLRKGITDFLSSFNEVNK